MLRSTKIRQKLNSRLVEMFNAPDRPTQSEFTKLLRMIDDLERATYSEAQDNASNGDWD